MSEVFEFDPPWSDRVRFSPVGGGFAYAPNTAFVRASVTDDEVTANASDDDVVFVEDGPLEGFRTARGSFDVVRVVASMRANGIDAQPDHVFFAHGGDCGCCCGPHPAAVAACAAGSAPGVTANPLYAHAVTANPLYAHAVFANPLYAHPLYAHPLWGYVQDPHGPKHSSAGPARMPSWYTPPVVVGGPGNIARPRVGPRVVVLDTGLAGANFMPPMLAAAASIAATTRSDDEYPDSNNDGWLDPVAGHGTFIAGVIERIAPGCDIELRSVIGPQGDAKESTIVDAINAVALRANPPDFLSLSFGGPVWDIAPLLSAAVLRAQQRGVVVVASAGNEGTCRPSYPAAIPGVVSVGAIGPGGPAPFTNYGSWVRACAPGVDVVSSFFRAFDGPLPRIGGYDPDEYDGWATWSGTSFSAPAVVGALVREMRIAGCSAAQAVARIVDAPWLGRIAGLGTVVNV